MRETDKSAASLLRNKEEHAASATAACSSGTPSHWFMIRLSSLGDVALTTGVLAWWRRTRGWTFTVITKAAFAPIFAGHPAVTQVIALNAADLTLGRLVPLFRKVAASAGPAGLIDLHGTPRSRLLSLLWQGPVCRFDKLGLERRAFLLSRGLLFRQRLNARNIPQRYAGAVDQHIPPRAELLPIITLTPEECAYGERIGSHLAGTSRLVALHPYAAHPDKAWSAEAWNKLVALLDAENLAWFVIGRSGDAPPRSVPPERDFTNKTSLRETCALLKAADALITGDSGPMHLASGVGTPVVALFGPTTAEWGFMPAGPHDQIVQASSRDQRLACRPCGLHGGAPCSKGRLCMTSITPHKVLEALNELLAHAASPTSGHSDTNVNGSNGLFS